MNIPAQEPENQTRQTPAEDHESSVMPDAEANQHRAILVIHGIGQQRRFESLDRFANGMRKALSSEIITHRTHRDDSIFEHSIRLEGDRQIDIYEYHWAPLTSDKSTFASVVRWLYATGFTPLKRFAFNLSLLIQQARKRSQRSDASLRVWAAAIFGGKIGLRISWGKFTLLASGLFILELLRVIYVLVLALLIIGGVALLVGSSGDLYDSARAVLEKIDVSLLRWHDYVTAFLFVGSVVAFVTLGWSLPRQVQDLARLVKSTPAFVWRLDPFGWPSIILLTPAVVVDLVKDGFNSLKTKIFRRDKKIADSPAVQEPAPAEIQTESEEPPEEKPTSKQAVEEDSADNVTSTTNGKYSAEKIIKAVTGLYKGIDKMFGRSIRKWSGERQEKRYWRVEITGRVIYLIFSTLLLLPIYFLISILIDADTECIFGICLSTVVYEIGQTLGRDGLLTIGQIALLLVLADFFKRVFVDYVADVALYTMTDERSPHAETREIVLAGAVSRIRWLVHNYDSVTVAGHSLGSVIAYDAINQLCNEARLRRGSGDSGETDEIDANTLERLDLLVTFGSPLNKVLYFFRTTVKSYQTIRAHILHRMYSFRLPQELLTSDPAIRDGLSAEEGQDDSDAVPPILSSLVWLNVSSPLDPVSARLQFFEGVQEYRRWYLLPGFCHMSYWHDPAFYARVAVTLFPVKTPKS